MGLSGADQEGRCSLFLQILYVAIKRMSQMKTIPNGTRPLIVVLDGHTLNPADLSWAPLEALGALRVFPRTAPSDVIERAVEANIILANKVRLNAALLEQLPRLACICVTATGYNNIDTAAAAALGITVCNAVGYSTHSVAQHVFALLLEISNQVALHDRSVRALDWSSQPDFSYWKHPLMELAGKTMGIYGFGRIGQQVGEIARAFGMQVIAYRRQPDPEAPEWVRMVPLETLFAESDVLSLNAPLNPDNINLVDKQRLASMKPGAILINTGRGELIVENDLEEALRRGRPAFAALDVLRQEPPPSDHPLFALPNCLITPHQAWASREARQRLLDISIQNVRQFLMGTPVNRVN